MSISKYIVYDSGFAAEMIVFGDSLQHADLAAQMGVTDRIVSAGFLLFRVVQGEFLVDAYGKSHSLDVKSNEISDTMLARKLFNDK